MAGCLIESYWVADSRKLGKSLKMRNHIVVSGIVLAAALASTSAQAQTASKATVAPRTAATHDISGVWRASYRLLTLSREVPPRTPAGQAMFDAYKPSYGPRAIPPASGNDPQGNCDPLGIPRLLLTGGFTAIEMVQIPDRVLQFFEHGHVWRTIWTDGRELPKDTEDPTWLGYSVGKWDGDIFVVQSTGLDERTWIDHFGNPHSDAMRLEERYRRLDRDNLELTITIDDPKIYTKPWVSEKKTFKLEPKTQLREDFCVPSEEQAFNKRMRDPAGGKTGK